MFSAPTLVHAHMTEQQASEKLPFILQNVLEVMLRAGRPVSAYVWRGVCVYEECVCTRVHTRVYVHARTHVGLNLGAVRSQLLRESRESTGQLPLHSGFRVPGRGLGIEGAPSRVN